MPGCEGVWLLRSLCRVPPGTRPLPDAAQAAPCPSTAAAAARLWIREGPPLPAASSQGSLVRYRQTREGRCLCIPSISDQSSTPGSQVGHCVAVWPWACHCLSLCLAQRHMRKRGLSWGCLGDATCCEWFREGCQGGAGPSQMALGRGARTGGRGTGVRCPGVRGLAVRARRWEMAGCAPLGVRGKGIETVPPEPYREYDEVPCRVLVSQGHVWTQG